MWHMSSMYDDGLQKTPTGKTEVDMLKILIVDDDPEIRGLISKLIKMKGAFEIAEASSVKEADSLCTRIKFDLIFLDHNVADGNAWVLAEMIFLNPDKYGKPKIIAMSGSVLPENANRSHKNFSQFIAKPFNISSIYTIIEQVSQKH